MTGSVLGTTPRNVVFGRADRDFAFVRIASEPLKDRVVEIDEPLKTKARSRAGLNPRIA
jgi:hypothetical protein